MLSMPPATITSCVPASSMSWASIAAFMPEPHILLSVTAPALSGSPPLNAAWRAGGGLAVAGNEAVAHQHFAHGLGRQAGTRQRGPDGHAAQVVGGQVGKVALQRPHG